jgi:multiple sugar transport system substrate-binding protein
MRRASRFFWLLRFVRWAGMLGALCTLPLLASCGQQQDPRTTVVLKHSKLFGDPAPFRSLLAEFERHHPDLAVREETLPSSSDEQHQFYAVNLQAKSASFDVLAVDVIWVAEFAAAGWLRDLSHLLPAQERSGFFSGPIEAVTYAGRSYAIPWFVDAGLLYYRKDLLDKHGFAAPRTWFELVRIAQAVMAREPGLEGFVWQGKQYEGLVCNALEYIWSNGGEVLEDGRLTLDSPANRTALGFMADLIYRHRVTPASVTTATEEPSRHVFGQGRALFLRNWPYAWRPFQAEGSAVKDKVGVTVLPHFEGGRPAATLGGWQLGVNRYSAHPEAAERLVQFLTSAQARSNRPEPRSIATPSSPPRIRSWRSSSKCSPVRARAPSHPITCAYPRCCKPSSAP